MTQPNVDTQMIPIIKENHDGKPDKDFVKLKLHRDYVLPMLDLYEFKIYLFDNGYPEEIFLLVCNFNMTLTASGTLEAVAKYKYLCTLVWGEALRQFDLLSTDIKGTETLNVDYIILGLAQYFLPVNFLSKQKRAMRCEMEKPSIMTVRRFAAHFIGLS